METMQGPNKIDFGKLLGFDTVGDQIAGNLDLQDATFGAKLGAKVGEEENSPTKLAETVVKPN